MRIEELLWDDDNERHIRRHHVDEEEVEEVVYDSRTRVQRTTDSFGFRRYLFWGRTAAGRHLLVVLDHLGGGTFRPVTARNMTPGEKRRFRR